MKMLGFILTVGLAAAAAAPALAENPPACRVAEPILETSYQLPLVAKAIDKKQLDIIVVGAGSSTLPGPNGAKRAYPARLQSALAEKLPGVTVKVTTDVKAGTTATDALKSIVSGISSAKPALLVWQAGTVDAMRSVELDAFSATLDKGIDAAHNAKTDVVLLNAQYSPRTESIIALGNYMDNMRWVALQHEIPLFDRFGIMKLWAELGTFDFNTATNKLDMAEQVHDCIGRLLADLILEAAKPVEPSKGVR